MGTQNLTSSSINQHEESLEQCGKMVDRFIKKDSSYPQLLETLHVPGHTEPSVSGLQDVDYPDVSFSPNGQNVLAVPNIATRIPLPAELFEQFSHMQCNCMMGLFPEIGRAWLTIDSDIFVWTYNNAGDLAYFNSLNETILSVGLVKPKKGIFRSHIHYLLCLATPIEIVLLGVSFSTSADDARTDYGTCEMHLLPEPLFTLSSDNTFFVTIASTTDGRIFMGSKDGCLYELIYQAVDGWFSRKCRKVNHSSSSFNFLIPSFINIAFSDDAILQIVIDNTRHILYTRSEKGTIEVFDLGSKGTSTSKIVSMTQQNITHYATNIARTIDRSNFTSIVHISAIENRESTHINLIAITHTGVRLYFTTSMTPKPLATTRPDSLHLLHIRLPPGFAANAALQRPNKVQMAHYRKGNLLLVSSQSEDSDTLWLLSADTFPFHQQLMETQSIIPLESKVWAISEMFIPQQEPVPQRDNIDPLDPPLVVVQHKQIPRQFLLLTPQGVHIVTQLRPVDRLRQLLIQYQGPDNDAVKACFMLHQEEQAAASCLILACSKNPQDAQIAEWATNAFFLFGGDPSLRYPTFHSSDPQEFPFGSPLQMASPPVGGTGRSQMTSTPLGSGYGQTPLQQIVASRGPEIVFSGKHNAVYLYFCRIVRPIWNSFFVREVPVQTEHGAIKYLASTVSGEDFEFYLNQVTVLKEFVDRFIHCTITAVPDGRSQNLSQRVRNFMLPEELPGGDVSHLHQQLQKKSLADAQIQERTSLGQLQQLMNRVSEILGLCKVLVDHQFHVIAGSLNRDYQVQLRSMTFRDFFIGGTEIASALVNALINRYLGDNATTDAISGRLQEICPSVYKCEDAVSAKTIEILLRAKNVQNIQEKEQLLQEALRLAKQISLQLNIPLICSYFKDVHCYNAIVELCLTAAAQVDPNGIALQYYRNGEPAEDQQGLNLNLKRIECYKPVLNTISQLLDTSSFHHKSPSIPKIPGPPPPSDPNTLNPMEAGEQFERMFASILKSTDELCHVVFYDWLLDRNLVEKLLEVRTPFLENYLKRSALLHPDSPPVMDLLWKFYEKSGNYSAAARILAKLAERKGADLSLAQRIECLSRAAICLKSSAARTTMSSEGEFLQELEEKIEVARIQLQVCEALQRMDHSPTIAITQLNSELLDITRLYEDFADPYHLTECKLAIVHCANHSDTVLIESLWQEIIDKEFASFTGSAPGTIMTVIGNKMKSLGRLYITSLKFFPMVFLIRYLEQKSSLLSLDYEWVFKTMESIGVSFTRLFDIYDKLYKTKDPVWPSLRKPLHLLHVLYKLIDEFASNPYGNTQERRQLVTSCLDCIARYLVDLQALGPAMNENVEQLMSDFKVVQAKLERLT